MAIKRRVDTTAEVWISKHRLLWQATTQSVGGAIPAGGSGCHFGWTRKAALDRAHRFVRRFAQHFDVTLTETHVIDKG